MKSKDSARAAIPDWLQPERTAADPDQPAPSNSHSIVDSQPSAVSNPRDQDTILDTGNESNGIGSPTFSDTTNVEIGLSVRSSEATLNRSYAGTPGSPISPYGVNVKRAEVDFLQVTRELSQTDRISIGKDHVTSSRKPLDDEEKAVSVRQDSVSSASEEHHFDLEAVLRGNLAENEAIGVRSKRIGVVWEDLTVRGIGGIKNYVKTFPSSFIGFLSLFPLLLSFVGFKRKNEKEVDILKDFKGMAKPGEMVLVLGKPGAGCTTFLKLITNQRFGYTGIDGTVTYGPWDYKSFAKRYRGEAVYNGEDDVHLATLSVKQTLDFALETKVPGKRPAGLSRNQFRDKVTDMLLRMFNIEHTKNTVVGNAFVRGVSGGERKRVSIAEMMVTNACVTAWDNSTRGLDASTAVDYAKSLRILTDIHNVTTFVSLYQASESIYKHFDRVLVINEGRQVYFGPADQARAYFEGLGFLEKPRQTTADYLTGCTDEYERQYQPGRDATNAPYTPDQMAEAYRKSRIAAEVETEMQLYRKAMDNEKHIYDEFKEAVVQGKRYTSKRSVYSIPLYLQVAAIFKRQFLLKWQDKMSLAITYTASLSTAVILGTTWVDLPRTSSGAFTRGGLMFISILFNSLTAFAELAATMFGRPIVNKHRSYAFYQPSALWMAQILVDTCFATVQITVFTFIVYFSCHLYREPGAFFTFILYIVSSYVSMTLFFRTVGCLCPNFDVAIRAAALLITFLVVTCGYLVQEQNMPGWLSWIYYVNALGLMFSALMSNEFKHIDLTCTEGSLIPNGPGYNDIGHQVCTLQGATYGSSFISGKDYLRAAFTYDPRHQWRNWGITVALIGIFFIANTILGEYIRFGAGGKTITLYKKENKERKELNERLREQRKQKRSQNAEGDAGSELQIDSQTVLTWEGVNYDVPVAGGQLRLLKDVYGYVKPGSLTALMGSSGAGKTTLLDVLAARKNIGIIKGDILMDGIAPGAAFQRGTAYAEQLDVHEPAQTVREALRFSADLRQPYETPQAEKYQYVEEVISLLELEDIADAIIGDADTGLAVEQRKRVTIGVELAAKPELLLFLDEPTSGLDSQSAFNIVRFLKKLAAAGQAILCTIHQPNSTVFENFDRLLLLETGGRTVYFGDIGKGGETLLDYFSRNGAVCPFDANPAEWMLDAIGAGQSRRIGSRPWSDVWNDSPEFAQVKRDIIDIKRVRTEHTHGNPAPPQKEYATPLWHQIKVVTRRQSLAFWRNPAYGFTRLWNHWVVALVSGLAFINLGNSKTNLQYRLFVVFQCTVIPALILASVEPKYVLARMISYREQAAKAYRIFPFVFSMVVAEMPYNILCAVSFFLPLYYIPGFQSSPDRAGFFFLLILIVELFSVTLGQAIAALTPSAMIAALCNPCCIIVFALLQGIVIPAPLMPKFWRYWLYELDPFTRVVGASITNELHGRPVICTPAELNNFTAPAGQSCGEYMADFFARGAAGYITNNSTQDCSYCAYKSGDQFYEPLGYSFSHRWRDLGILAGFVGSNLIILFMAARYLNYNKR